METRATSSRQEKEPEQGDCEILVGSGTGRGVRRHVEAHAAHQSVWKRNLQALFSWQKF